MLGVNLRREEQKTYGKGEKANHTKGKRESEGKKMYISPTDIDERAAGRGWRI